MDYHTFWDRSAKRTATFSVQMGAMVVAYMAWLFSQKSVGQKGFFDSDE